MLATSLTPRPGLTSAAVLDFVVVSERAPPDRAPPPLVRPVPVDGLSEAGLERGLRLPPESVPELRPIDRVADDVARAVRHPLQERLRLGEGPEDRLSNLEDRSLRGRAGVEGLTLDPIGLQEEIQRGAVILHVDPVPGIRSGPVDL